MQTMPKWLLYGLGAAADFAIAAFMYRGGRVVIPLVLALAGLAFAAAAVGAFREQAKQGGSSPGAL